MEEGPLIAPHAVEASHPFNWLEWTQKRLRKKFLPVGDSRVFDRIIDIRHDAGAPGWHQEDVASSGDGSLFQ